jgi:cytidine deaminase
VTPEELAARALANRKNAYAPYSHFQVGAALLAVGGRVFDGCNVENAAYGVSLCAERAALAAAVSAGYRNFTAIAVAATGGDYCLPCGVCRQALFEFAPELTVYCVRPDGRCKTFPLRALLPEAFSMRDA